MASTQEDDTAKPRQRSFRRKYNKIRYHFKKLMDSNTRLHEEEQSLMKVSRRIQEQNDQLLDILLDVNNAKRTPKHLYYSLDTEAQKNGDLNTQENGDVDSLTRDSAEEILEDARRQVESGDLMQRDYDILVGTLRDTLRKNLPAMSLRTMEETVSHTSLNLLATTQIPDDIKDNKFSTYLDPEHEDEYLAALDAKLAGTQSQPDTQPPKQILSEVTYRNPVSIWNWLRKNKPEVFLTEGGGAKDEEKETKPAASTPAVKRESRAAKRQSGALVFDDEEAQIMAESAPPTKSKRKRDDDAYRPKGGGAKKRKKSTGKTVDTES